MSQCTVTRISEVTFPNAKLALGPHQNKQFNYFPGSQVRLTVMPPIKEHESEWIPKPFFTTRPRYKRGANGQKKHIRIVLAPGSAHDQKRHMPLSCKGWKHPSLTCTAAKKTPLEAARSCDQKRHTPPRLHFCYAEKKKSHFQMGFHSPCARVQPLPAAPGDALHPTASRPGASLHSHSDKCFESASCKGSKHSSLTCGAIEKKHRKPRGYAIRKDTHNQDFNLAMLTINNLSLIWV